MRAMSMEQRGKSCRHGRAWLAAGVLALLAAVPARLVEARPSTIPERKIEIPAGDWQDVYIRLGVDSRPDLLFDVRLKPPDDPRLALRIRDERSGQQVLRSTLRHTPGGRTLWLRVKADRSVSRREYRAGVVVMTAEDPVDGGEVRRAAIPLLFTVRPAGLAAGGHPGRWLSALAATVLTFFACTSAAHSRFLDLDRLAQRLQPLRWNESGKPEGYKDYQGWVKSQIEASLKWQDRALSWLWANPFVFGLPGKTYAETVEIFLYSDHKLSIRPIPWHEAQRHGKGRLFASAMIGDQVNIHGGPTPEGRIGSLSVLPRDGAVPDRFSNRQPVELLQGPPRTHGNAGWKIVPLGTVTKRRQAWGRLRWEGR